METRVAVFYPDKLAAVLEITGLNVEQFVWIERQGEAFFRVFSSLERILSIESCLEKTFFSMSEYEEWYASKEQEQVYIMNNEIGLIVNVNDGNNARIKYVNGNFIIENVLPDNDNEQQF